MRRCLIACRYQGIGRIGDFLGERCLVTHAGRNDKDRVTAEIFVNDLRDAGYLVGDNEPYSGKAPQDYTIDNHAETAGISHVGIEIRQDLIHHDDGVERIADVMQPLLASLPARLKPTEIDSKRSV